MLSYDEAVWRLYLAALACADAERDGTFTLADVARTAGSWAQVARDGLPAADAWRYNAVMDMCGEIARAGREREGP